MTAQKEQWASRAGLVLAMAGNAVGLGNFLRFPAQAAQNGGGAFLIPYLVAFVLMGIPLLWVEWAMGRYGGQFGHHSAPGMLDRMGKSRFLKYIGVFGIFTNLTHRGLLLLHRVVDARLRLALARRGRSGPRRRRSSSPRYLGQHAARSRRSRPRRRSGSSLTLALNVWILSRGLAKGIELAAKIGMPLLILFGVVLAVRGLRSARATRASSRARSRASTSSGTRTSRASRTSTSGSRRRGRSSSPSRSAWARSTATRRT